MKQRNSYSRIVQDLEEWDHLSKGSKIRLFQHCIEKDISSFLINFSNPGKYDHGLGTAFSESGLSRDEVQLIGIPEKGISKADGLIEQVEKILDLMDTDYLDLLILDLEGPSEEIIAGIEQLRAQEKIVEIGVLEDKPGEKKEFLKEFPASATLSAFRFTPAAVKSLTLAEAASEETTQMIIPVSGDWENENESLQRTGEKYNLRPKELLFAWLLHHKAHYHPVIKGDSEAVIDSAVKAFHTTIIDEDLEKLPERL